MFLLTVPSLLVLTTIMGISSPHGFSNISLVRHIQSDFYQGTPTRTMLCVVTPNCVMQGSARAAETRHQAT